MDSGGTQSGKQLQKRTHRPEHTMAAQQRNAIQVHNLKRQEGTRPAPRRGNGVGPLRASAPRREQAATPHPRHLRVRCDSCSRAPSREFHPLPDARPHPRQRCTLLMAERARAPTRGTDTGTGRPARRAHTRASPEVGRGRARRPPPGPRPPRGASPPHWPARAAVPPVRRGGARPGRSGARPEAGERPPGWRVCHVTRPRAGPPGVSAPPREPPSGERPKRQPRVAHAPWLPSQVGLAADQNAPGFGRRSLATSAYCFTNAPPTIGCHGRWGGSCSSRCLRAGAGARGAAPDTAPCCKPLGMNVGGPVERHVALLGPFPDAA